MAGVANAVRRFLAGRSAGREPGVVAVSGGADSVALLRALVAARRGPLTVAHFNHRLRGAESDADAEFVRELAGRLGLPFRLGGAEVAKAAADAGENLEAAARRLRYAWLAEVASEAGAKWVATGHTADDQAETVLHRLIRGAGLQGLRGIAAERGAWGFNLTPQPPSLRGKGEQEGGNLYPVTESPAHLLPSLLRGGAGGEVKPPTDPGRSGRVENSLLIVRPLLPVTRAEILAFLAALNQPFREDATNADPRFTRNRIRAELLPLLKSFNPEVVRALGRLAEQADEAHAILAEQGRELLAAAERPRVGETIVLDAAALTSAPPLVVREALRWLWQREGWPVAAMGFEQWDRAVEVARKSIAGWDFPGGVSARSRGRVVQIGRGS